MRIISIVAAMDENRVIGNGNKLPSWTVPGDLKRFKSLTLGKVVIMGRKTYESIGKPLLGRLNIVISTTMKDPKQEGIWIAPSLEEALAEVERLALEQGYNHNELMVMGGSQVYEQSIALASRLYLTLVRGQYEGDAFFPVVNASDWMLTSQEDLPTHSYLTYDRKQQDCPKLFS